MDLVSYKTVRTFHNLVSTDAINKYSRKLIFSMLRYIENVRNTVQIRDRYIVYRTGICRYSQ